MAPRLIYRCRKIGVTCLQAGSDSLPHVSVRCKSFTSQVLLKEHKRIEISGPYAANRTWKWLRHCGCEVMEHEPYSPELAFHDFQLFGPTKKHVPSKQYATLTYLQQAVPPTHTHLITDCSTPGHIYTWMSEQRSCHQGVCCLIFKPSL